MERAALRAALFALLLPLIHTRPNKDDWDIYSFHINSTVTSRYATTVISSRVVNRMNQSKEIEFHVRIPKNAFISKFRMLLDGQMYDGIVKVKEEAQQQYTQAVSRGESAGIVSSIGRTLEEFKTSVTVAGHRKVTFELTYEELLKRRLGKYELQIYARPMQPVKDFKIDVHINEKAGINFMEFKGAFSTDTLANAITKTLSAKEALVSFQPTVAQQKLCEGCGEQGMNGDLVIVYDVNRDSSLGDIQESDGYFVHHFAPVSLPRIPKNVVFLIDQSGSMHGRKMHQTRTALVHILGDLAEDDNFGLITFDSSVMPWRRELLRANQDNLRAAKEFARSIQDRGATDINAAVLEGARMLNNHPREGAASILILLTDGDPTTGETNLEVIQSNVRKAIQKKFPLYCLGFGFDVNFEFLEKMALENSGAARRIYDDSDADLQLKGFYEEVATPLLLDVTMIYSGGTNLTQTEFSHYYNGSEIVVAGQITDNNVVQITPRVVAVSKRNRVEFSKENSTLESSESSFTQRVWAFLTVKQLLDKELQLSGVQRDRVKKEVLALSLKYNFVTPLTSMVVTKPVGETTEVLNKPKEGKTHQQFTQQRGHAGFPLLAMRPPGRPGLPGPPARFPGFAIMMPERSGGVDVSYAEVLDTAHLLPAAPEVPTRGRSYGGVASILHVDYDAFDTEMVDLLLPAATEVPTRAPQRHRFLFKAVNQSIPLCFDVIGSPHLRLLHVPSRALSVNGQLHSEADGFQQIFIHQNNFGLIQIFPNEIVVQEGHTARRYTTQQNITAGRVTIIWSDKGIDVSDGHTHMDIVLHEKLGERFLWPSMRQLPSDDNIEGLLALLPARYEVVQQGPSPRLQIKDQEIDVTSASAMDYSLDSGPLQECWLMTAESVLQRPLQDFTLQNS